MLAKRSRSDRGRGARPARQILIVDDEESLAFFMKQGLLEVDPAWQIDTANTGEEAVIKINRYAYGLIIADLRMPGLNGLELLQMVRALEPKTKVVLMTAYGSEQIAQEARRLQVFRYVTKPFPIEEAKTWASEALGHVAPPTVEGASPAPVEAPPMPPPAVEATPVAQVEAAPETRMAPESAGDVRQADDPVLSRLTQLRFRTGAQLAVVCDAAGHILAEAGSLPAGGPSTRAEVGPLAARIASSLRDTWPRGTALGELAEPSVLLQKSAGYAVSAAALGAGVAVVLVHAGGAHRVESILAQLQSAARDLAGLLPDVAVAALPPVPPAAVDPLPKPRQARAAQPAPEPPPAPVQVAGMAAAPGSEWEIEDDEGGDDLPSDGSVLSWDQAQALGLVDAELLSKLMGSEKPSSA